MNAPSTDASIRLRASTLADLAYCYGAYADGMRPLVEQIYGWNEDDQRCKFIHVFKPEESSLVQGRIGETLADLGWVQVAQCEDSFHVKELHMAPGSRNFGLGTWTLSQIIEEAADHDCDVRLSTLKISPALRFYQRLGFRVVREGSIHFDLRRFRQG